MLRWILDGLSLIPVLFPGAIAAAGAFLATGLGDGAARADDIARRGAVIGCAAGGAFALAVALGAWRLAAGGAPSRWTRAALVTGGTCPSILAGALLGVWLAGRLVGVQVGAAEVPFDALIPAFAPLAPALAFALRSRAPAP
jgi:hypothetical protein